MIGAHADCLTLPESQFILELLRDAPEAFDPTSMGRRVVEHFRFKTWEVDLQPPVGEEATALGSYRELIEWFVARYGDATERSGRGVWVEHSPFNAQYAETLFELFPDARLVHLVRDGRAVAASVMKLEWGPNEIHVAAPWWAHRLSFGLGAESHFGPERVRRVRYEDLITKPEETLESLCPFLGIDYSETMLAADGLRVPGFTTDFHRLVGSRPDPARVEAWRSDLSRRQIEIFENVTGELLSYLGYEPDFGLSARPMTRREKVMPFLRDHLFRRRANRARTKLRERRTIAAGPENPSGDADPTA